MTKFRLPHVFHCLTIGLTLTAGLLAAGCGSDEVIAGPDANLATLLIDNRTATAMGYRLDWESQVVISDGFRLLEMDVFDDIVVTREGGTILTVLEARDGNTRWTEVLGDPLQTYVGTARVDNRLLVSSSTGLFHFDIETGQLLDKHRLATVVNTRPVIINDLAVYGSANGHVLAHNWRTGFKQWAYDTYASIDTQPVLVGRDLVIVNEKGNVLVFDGTGHAIGRRTLFGTLSNRPVTTDDTVFLASKDQSIWALSRRGCRAQWRYRTESPLTDQPILIGDVLYQYVPGEGVVALNQLDGSVVWRCPDAKGRVLTQHGDRILTWFPNSVYEIDIATGRLVATHAMPRLLDIQADRLLDGTIYAATSSGRLSKLVPSN